MWDTGNKSWEDMQNEQYPASGYRIWDLAQVAVHGKLIRIDKRRGRGNLKPGCRLN
jgi:hypothetical protein